MEDHSENIQKYHNYKEQFKRLDKAVNQNFYLEAIFIEYAIFEDRAESVLHHAEKWDAYIKSRRGHEPNLYTKIKYIEKASEQKSLLLHRYFSDSLLEDIISWREERNRIIHALMKQALTTDELEHIATQGRNYARTFRNKAANYNRAAERRKLKKQCGEGKV